MSANQPAANSTPTDLIYLVDPPLPPVTDQIAAMALQAFQRHIAKHPRPADRGSRNTEAMRAALEDVRDSLIETRSADGSKPISLTRREYEVRRKDYRL